LQAWLDRANQLDPSREIGFLARSKSSSIRKDSIVQLGKLEANNVPGAVQNVDEKSYGPGVDGLLGMSFLSRFEVQMASGAIEIRTRTPKK
jgi:hypothetical protein